MSEYRITNRRGGEPSEFLKAFEGESKKSYAKRMNKLKRLIDEEVEAHGINMEMQKLKSENSQLKATIATHWVVHIFAVGIIFFLIYQLVQA